MLRYYPGIEISTVKTPFKYGNIPLIGRDQKSRYCSINLQYLRIAVLAKDLKLAGFVI